MNQPIRKRTSSRNASMRMLESGHCAQAMLKDTLAALGVTDGDLLIRAASGLAGGIGHHGAACGALTGGCLALSVLPPPGERPLGLHMDQTLRNVNDFVHRFTRKFGGTTCREIIDRDFTDNWEVRRHVVFDSMGCVRLVSITAGLIAETLEKGALLAAPHVVGLAQGFADARFNCAEAVFNALSARAISGIGLDGKTLIPLNGGFGYQGCTCAALVAGCLVIGLAEGADAGEGGIFETLVRTMRVFAQGANAHKNASLSATSRAMVKCAELAEWFEERFSSAQCRELTQIDFADEQAAWRYFSGDRRALCQTIVEATVHKTAGLI